MESGKINLMKISGTVNPADFLTKPKSAKEMSRLSEALNYDMPTRKDIQGSSDAGVMEISKWIGEAIRARINEKEGKR